MSLLIANNEDDSIRELEKTQHMVSILMKTPHYARLGDVGVFTIVTKAKAIGLDPIDALNGAMYYVQGKTELTSQTMNYLIRAAGHSITKDDRSNSSICILKGRRADNGDTWTASFSIEDAKRAGIYRNQWDKYPDDMLFARAISRLARQLFPDVIKGCYVQGEIADAQPFDTPAIKHDNTKIHPIELNVTTSVPTKEIEFVHVSKEQADELMDIIKETSTEYQEKVNNLLAMGNLPSLYQLPLETYERLKKKALEERAKFLAPKQQEEIDE